jgi:hypothetical protein
MADHHLARQPQRDVEQLGVLVVAQLVLVDRFRDRRDDSRYGGSRYTNVWTVPPPDPETPFSARGPPIGRRFFWRPNQVEAERIETVLQPLDAAAAVERQVRAPASSAATARHLARSRSMPM